MRTAIGLLEPDDQNSYDVRFWRIVTEGFPASPSAMRNKLGSLMNGNRIDRNLTNHPPVNTFITDLMEEVRELAKRLAHYIDHACPETREKSLAQTNLEQAVMWAIASLARNQEETLALHEQVAA